jgi:RNase P protein component
VGFAVPARALPAVRRNRVRRLMRAAFRAEQHLLEEQLRRARSSLEGVLVYRPKQKHEVRKLGLQDVRDDLARIVRLVCERL